jgi:hypothetical protein
MWFGGRAESKKKAAPPLIFLHLSHLAEMNTMTRCPRGPVLFTD